MIAYLKRELAGESILVRRAMSWVVRPSEKESTGHERHTNEIERRGRTVVGLYYRVMLRTFCPM